MDFSWTTISLVDIGLASFWGVIVATGWIAKKHADRRYNVLQQKFSHSHSAVDQRYNALQQEHVNLQREFSSFQSAADQRYNALQREHEALKEENATLRSMVDALTTEQKALQSAHDRLAGRHDELVERVMPVFEILAREKLMEINARNET